MNKLQQIDNKIIQLKKLKTDIETRLARELYKKIQALLGEDFTLQLALVIVSENWKGATLKQKEAWRAQADNFPFFGLSRLSSKNPEKIKSNVRQESCSDV